MVNKLIDYSKIMVIPLIVLLSTSLLLSILNLLGVKSYSTIILIVMVITTLISGFFVGKKTDKNGYINGLIFGLALSLIMFILSLLFKNKYILDTIIYYLIISASSTVGSMIGIQKKAD